MKDNKTCKFSNSKPVIPYQSSENFTTTGYVKKVTVPPMESYNVMGMAV